MLQFQSGWIWISAGVLAGGLAVKYIGFRAQVDPTGNGFKNFARTVCYFKLGALTSVVSMCLIKMSKISKCVQAYPRTTLLITMYGMFKLRPDTGPQEQPTSRLNLIISSLMFYVLPSLYYSKYSDEVLMKTLFFTIMVVTVCFVTGTIIPLENNHFFLNSFGYEISRIGIVIVIASALDRIVLYEDYRVFPKYVIHFGATIVLSGLLTDDIQQVKNKFLETAQADDEPLKSVVDRSVTIFIESVLVFGRVADIIYYLLDQEFYE